jgi:hypothetical protein
MWWLFVVVGLATAGLLVLGVLSARVYAEVRALARQVAAGSQALGLAGERLQRAAHPVAERAGRISRR